MRVQHNIMAMNAYRNYTSNVSAMKKNLERLSSGYKINRAGDDAAGLAISEKMRAQITGLEAAQKNAKDGISLVQTAEGALTEVHDMLNRMVELATQSANGTYDNDTDRYQLQKEMDQLKAEINRIADSANFNGIKLLDGSMSTSGGTAIVNIESTSYQKASSADGAFTFEYLRNRPDAGQNGSQAYFEISLDDLGLVGVGGAAGSITISLTVGSVTITVSSLTIATTGMSANAIANAILDKIKSADGAGVAHATSAAGVGILGDNETNGDCILIGGHVWQVGASNGKLTFTQMDKGFMTASDEAVIPDGLKVDIDIVNGGSGAINWNKPNVNWNVQNTKYYDPSGAGLQARAEMTVDFSKLKDGDTITVGTTTYTVYLNASTGENTKGIYLKGIDLDTTDGQKKALDKIVEALSSNGKWTAGNGGVQRGGKGVVSFQSLSDYEKDLTTETKVMNEFKYKSAGNDASVSFEVDPSLIHEGDTFTINGVTYEFTKSSKVTTSGNVAIQLGTDVFDEDGGVDLSASSIAAKIVAVMSQEKYAGGGLRYEVKQEGDRITITVKDDPSTENVNENRIDIKLSSGGGSGLLLQIGDTSDSYNQLRVNISDCHTISLGLDKISIADQDDAQAAVDVIKSAINYVSDVRGTLGATQNRLDHTINNLSVMTENIQDAESSIRDTDIAEEMMAYTKNNILIQASQAMLAQANQVPQGVLQLLQ